MPSFGKRGGGGDIMIDSTTNQIFFVPKMEYPDSINLFGVRWEQKKIEDREDSFAYYFLFNTEFGDFTISEKAVNSIISSIDKDDYYKALSLIYEQNINNNIFYITMKDEKNKLQLMDSNHIFVSIEGFLQRFPSDFIEIQQRALINLYNQCFEYGQEINSINKYTFFARNKSELLFFLESMKSKDWIDTDIKKWTDGSFSIKKFPIIKEKGWIEIEKTIKRNRKKQVFIAMKFKDMDNIYNAIYQAVEDAQFIPLRIDKKEHINQISNEIQYEISQSGLIVADVTEQNQGVYFEAGYAIGLNIPVIWTCREDEISKIHFDTRQYNTIFWKDENDLYEKLKKRIIAIMGLKENQGHFHA
jgi:nucleoside 2-deoxyribosyltransferase